MYNVTVLLDVDGVLCDWAGEVLKLAEEIVGHSIQPAYEQGSLSLNYLGLTDKQLSHLRNLIAAPNFASNLSPYVNAKAAIYHFRRRLECVYFVTAPWGDSPTWCYDRTKWLLKHDLARNAGNIIYTYKKALIRGNVFIDDSLENVLAWNKVNGDSRGGLSVLWRTKWNEAAEVDRDVLHTDKWDDVFAALDRRKAHIHEILA